ncbi:MAG TPA: MarR family transcriptional regulator [Thermodesulfobacteriota bacterium]
MPRGSVDRPLTRREAETLDAIVRLRRPNGLGPTVRELAQAFGITKYAADCRVQRLLKRGLVTRERRAARTVRVVEPYLVDAAGHVTPLQAAALCAPALV